MRTSEHSPPVFLSPAQVARRYGVSLPTLWRWRQAGRLPEPRRLGANTVRWHLDDLAAFEAGQRSAA